MIYTILNILSLLALTFILCVGMYVIYFWVTGIVLTEKFLWVCEYCGDTIKAYHQPFCKPCSHIERKSVKMIRIKND